MAGRQKMPRAPPGSAAAVAVTRCQRLRGRREAVQRLSHHTTAGRSVPPRSARWSPSSQIQRPERRPGAQLVAADGTLAAHAHGAPETRLAEPVAAPGHQEAALLLLQRRHRLPADRTVQTARRCQTPDNTVRVGHKPRASHYTRLHGVRTRIFFLSTPESIY